jgi:DNA-directed RNA polymerase specialized sigma24 family protein
MWVHLEKYLSKWGLIYPLPTKEDIAMRALKEETFTSKFKVALKAEDYLGSVDFALRELSELERTAVSLRFFSPLTIAQVADRMGMSWDGADQLIDRAAEKIRSVLCQLPCAITTI